MRKSIIQYSLALASMVFLLKMLQYQYFIRDLSIEFSLGIVALFFTSLGVWAGFKLTQKKIQKNSSPSVEFNIHENTVLQSGISKREQEVLALMAKGFSNQEIADKLFVSLNTIKTHTSNLFLKLNVKRRTQAIGKAKEMGLIP